MRLFSRAIVRCAVFASVGLCLAVPQFGNAQTGPRPQQVLPVPMKFAHPGLLNNLDELQFIKKKIEAGAEPWKSAFEAMKATKFASPKYKPHPHEIVSSGFLGAGGGAGGAFDQNDDSIAAYTQALMWIFTGDEKYAEKSVEILNAWNILKTHEGPNWAMMAQWSGSMFPQSAELIRATYPKWGKEDIAKFSEMLSRAYLPLLHNRRLYGNREFGKINAMMAIGVFNDDRAAFAEGMSHWVSYVPSWIYLKEDGAPIPPSYWVTTPSDDELAKLVDGKFANVRESWIYAGDQVLAMMKEKHLGDDRNYVEKQYDQDKYWNQASQSAFVDGLCAETFRDLGHCDLGFYEMINAAEIAWHQGIDLYAIHAKRIIAFMEFEAFQRMGDPLPKEFYRVQGMGIPATYEIAYNHFHNRQGVDLPNTRLLLEKGIRPWIGKKLNESPGWTSVPPDDGIRATQICPVGLALAWETLTHAELGGTKSPVTNR